MYNLGILYLNGDGVEQDYKKAATWLTKIAKVGHSEAQYTLGELYEKGLGVKQDYSKAVKWYSMAASQGDVAAKEKLITLKKIC
jgi:TPR repeat protein